MLNIYSIKAFKSSRECKGKSLYDAIAGDSYGCCDPPIVSDWIYETYTRYMSSDWDSDYLDMFLDYYDNSDYIRKILSFRNSLKDCITNDDINKKCLLYKNDEIVKTFLIDWKYYCQNDRENYASSRANEDFSIWIEDIDVSNDDEVANFFDATFEITGVVIDYTDYDLSEVFFCWSCGEPCVINDFKEWFEVEQEEKYVDESLYCCSHCNHLGKVDDAREINKHLTDEWFISRMI